MRYHKKPVPLISIIFAILTALIILAALVKIAFFRQPGEWKPIENMLYQKEKVIDSIREGNRAYTIISREGRTDYGDLLAVFEQSPGLTWSRVYENDFEDLKPWKIELADIDGDGVQDILTAVRKTTHFDKVERNRLFIFNYEDQKLVKKWTGSLTGGDWKDFIAVKLLPISSNELVFIEQSENGTQHLGVYYWFDFGFIKLAESGSYREIRRLSVTGENCMKITYDNGQTATLTVQGGKIVETAPEQ